MRYRQKNGSVPRPTSTSLRAGDGGELGVAYGLFKEHARACASMREQAGVADIA